MPRYVALLRAVNVGGRSVRMADLRAGRWPRRACYVTFLRSTPDAAAAAEPGARDVPGERVLVRGRAVHWWLAKRSQEAKLSNARLERALGPGTTRGLKVVATLAARWGD